MTPAKLLLLLSVSLAIPSSAKSAQSVSSPTVSPPVTAQTPQTAQPSGQQSSQASTSGLRITFGDASNVVRLTAVEGDFLLTATGMADADKLADAELSKYAATLNTSDSGRVGGGASRTIEIGGPRFVGRTNAGGLSWLVNVKAPDLPANLTEKRLLRMTLGLQGKNTPYGIEYTLTNQAPSSATFDATPPGHDWIVSWSDDACERTYPLLIANKGEPLVDLKLVLSSLKKTDDGSSLAYDRLALLSRPDGAANERINLQPNETKTVYLRVDSGGITGPFGTFTGQVQLASEGTAAKPVPLTVKATSNGIRLIGSALVLIGLLVSLFVTNHLQPRLLRLQALRPATLLHDVLIDFTKEATTRGGGDVPGIVAEAERQAERLQPEALDRAGLLPLMLNLVGAQTDAASKLQTLMNEISARLAGLIVLRDAVLQIRDRHPDDRSRLPAAATAIRDLNAFAPSATNADTANAEAARVSGVLRREEAAGGAANELLEQVEPAVITTERLDFMLQQTANLAALIWAAVSLAIGVTYIYSDIDFGTPMDLLGMFLWGFGLTTFGAGIQQLTPRSVSSQIGLTLPKTGAAS